ncbi:MAG: DNA-binding response regulator, partial [Aquificota bacterium]
MPLVYVVEDDEDINELLVYNLKKEGFSVNSYFSGKDAIDAVKAKEPDIIILDIMLPDIDGLEVCKIIKADEKKKHIPIIMLTAKSTEIDKIVGLELGADDYITKPFSFRELLARIKAVLRRYNDEKKPTNKDNKLELDELSINPEKFEIKIKGKKVYLTAKEFKLLMALINSKNKVLSREFIIDTVWEDYPDIYDRTVDVHIKNLREKLENYGKFIKTIR